MSNNSPDRGYATPTTDLFTYRWPQHLKSVAGGVGEGGRMGISGVGYCPCKCVRGKPSLRTSGDKCCALILSVTFFLLVVRMAEQPRLKFQPQKCDTEYEFFLQHDFYVFYSFSLVGIVALKIYFLKVAWDDSVCPGGADWTTRLNQQRMFRWTPLTCITNASTLGLASSPVSPQTLGWRYCR